MARNVRGKDKHPRKKQPFCKKGHNISITGRDKHGACNICKVEYHKEYQQRLKEGTHVAEHRVQFCPKGHDTFVVGRRMNNGRCETCCLMDDRDDVTKDSRFKQICHNGHDTFITGRDKDGRCIPCLKEYQENYNKKYWEENKVELAKANKEYQETHREEINEMHKKWKKENEVHYKEMVDKWRKENREQINAQKNAYNKEQFKTNIIFKISRILRGRLRQAIKGNFKSGSAVRDLGCTIEFLAAYIAAKFHDGMTWDNWGPVWELDHIEALGLFNLTDHEQFLIACNYKNLQPLTVEEHAIKSVKDKAKIAKMKRELKAKIAIAKIG